MLLLPHGKLAPSTFSTTLSPPDTSPHRSDHSLPVTSICVGVGEVNAVVATASLDRSVKLWSIATGTLLRTVALPAAATAVAFDSGEHALYAGCSDGRIFEASLLGQEPPSLVSGAGGLHAGLAVLEGHTGAVASLAASLDGESLVSGGWHPGRLCRPYA